MTVEFDATEEGRDYPAMAEVLNRAAVEETDIDPGDLAEWDRVHRDAGRASVRILAIDGGEPVALGIAMQHPELPPQVWWGDVTVVPERRGRGVGRQLLGLVEDEARARGASRLMGQVVEGDDSASRFAAAAGYVEQDREWQSTLHLERFDPVRWRDVVAEVRAAGIGFVSFRSLMADADDAVDRVHRLWDTLNRHVPTAVQIASMAREDFAALYLDSDRALPDGFFLATDGEALVGLTQLLAVRSDTSALAQELTGVLPSHRGRHIATALKAEAARWAKEQGYATIRTWNAQSNAPMLAVNRSLGFEMSRGLVEVAGDL